MAKLYFYYGSMNAGKTTMLLQAAFNYEERGMKVLIMAPPFTCYQILTCRIGLVRKDISVFSESTDLYDYVSRHMQKNLLSCVFIDEAQFLQREQVYALCKVCDVYKIPVLCYGLRTDFRGMPFEGSTYLLALADKVVELKTICPCSRKAIMNLRKVDADDGTIVPVTSGESIDIGGNDKYISLCRCCYVEKYGADWYECGTNASDDHASDE